MPEQIQRLDSVAAYYLRGLPSVVLAAAARGDIDLMQLIRAELVVREVGLNGEWVGLENAMHIHGASDCKSGTGAGMPLETLG